MQLVARAWIEQPDSPGGILHILQGTPQLPCNRRETVLGEVVKVVGDNLPVDGILLVFACKLKQQALLERPCAYARRLEGLDCADSPVEFLRRGASLFAEFLVGPLEIPRLVHCKA